jgi:hypothetical protein
LGVTSLPPRGIREPWTMVSFAINTIKINGLQDFYIDGSDLPATCFAAKVFCGILLFLFVSVLMIMSGLLS